MFRALFILFILVPIIEIALLIQVAEVIGGWPTIALIVLTALVGARLVKQQGLSAIQNAQLEMAQGKMPAQELFTGICVIIAGVLLLTPGIMTDLFGFLLLMPPVRARLAKGLAGQAQVKMTTVYTQQSMYRDNGSEGTEPHRGPTTLEGEFKRKE